MLLKELSQPRHTVKKLNETLRKSYGRRVPVDIDIDRLKDLLEQVSKDLQVLVVEGVNPQDPEYARRLVIKHTAEKILEQRQKIQEASLADGVLDRVCSKLISCACDCINDGDDYEHALHKVMDIYRSSKYRFPDSEVENRVRNGVDRAFGMEPVQEYDRDTLFDDRDMDEGNKFTGARQDAIDAGEDEFEVDGEVYPVEEDSDKEISQDSEASYRHAKRILRTRDDEDELDEAKKKMKDPCWKDYKMVGTKMKGGKEVPNCVPESENEGLIGAAGGALVGGAALGPVGAIGGAMLGHALTDDVDMYEDTPPGMEDWVLDNKKEFKKRYGSRWEEVLYATAWKIHNQENGDK